MALPTPDLNSPLYVIEAARLGSPNVPIYAAGTEEHPYWTNRVSKAMVRTTVDEAKALKTIVHYHIKATRVTLGDLHLAVSVDSLVITRTSLREVGA